jgi:Flp pilus assembly CpaE family ATPase
MNQIVCTILTSDLELRAAAVAAIERIPNLEIIRGLSATTPQDQLIRFFRTSPARIALLDMRDANLQDLAGEVELHDPGIQFIALGEPDGAAPSWRGIQERVNLPLVSADLSAALSRRVRVLEKLPNRWRESTTFLSFLPAKPGSGATTLACGLADILAAGHKTLLCDLDFANGTVGFRYRLVAPYSLLDLAKGFESIDENLWSQMVSQSGKLDVLASSPQNGGRLRPDLLPQWIDFLRSAYDFVLFDLPSNLDDGCFEILKMSTRIFMVTTQELECLHLARLKADAIRAASLEERTSVLLNRFHKAHTLKGDEVEEVLKLSITAQFPNDYQGVQDAIRAGQSLKPGTPLYKALSEFAPTTNRVPQEPAKKSHKFLEFVRLPAFSYWRIFEASNER